MARPAPLTWLPLFHRALAAEIGIAFRISGVERTYFRNTLYECAKAAADAAKSVEDMRVELAKIGKERAARESALAGAQKERDDPTRS